MQFLASGSFCSIFICEIFFLLQLQFFNCLFAYNNLLIMKGTAEGGRSRRKCSPFFPREISKKCLWNCKRTMQRVTAKVLNWKIFPFDQLIDELIVCQKMPSSIVALLPFSNSLSLFIQSTLFSVKKKTRVFLAWKSNSRL